MATLPVGEVGHAVAIMGGVAALRLLEGLYRGAIIGLHGQVWLNVTSSVLATLRWAGGLGVLVWWSKTIEAFFAWQGIVSIITIALLRFSVSRRLPPSSLAATFSWEQLKRRRKFWVLLMISP